MIPIKEEGLPVENNVPVNKRIHAFTNDVLGNVDGFELAKLIKEKKISSKEVIEATIQRANKVNPTLNAIEVEDYERALIASAKIKVGIFQSVPTYFKDMVNVKGIPNYFGSRAFEGAQPAKQNDAIVDQILSMGFVGMGTSKAPEFGFICSGEYANYNNVCNPWNSKHSSGGSSSGAAALVAAGVVPIAHSADGGGSTRIPAHCNGLVGLKPSRGRIKLMKMFEKQVHHIAIDGVETRSVRDHAYFYHGAEQFYHDKRLPRIGLVTDPINKKLTIGYLDNINTIVDDATYDAYMETLGLLEDLGHMLKPVDFPINEQSRADFKLLWASSGFGVKYFGKYMFKAPYDPGKLNDFTKGLSDYYQKRIVETPGMLYRLKKSYFDYQKFYKDNNLDVLFTPTVSHLTPENGFLDVNLPFETVIDRMAKWACFSPLANATGAPSISLPLCHDKKTDLPIGMMFFANHGREKLLFELSYQLEAAKPWAKIYE